MKQIKGMLLYATVVFVMILALVSCNKSSSGNDTAEIINGNDTLETINDSSLTDNNSNTESDAENSAASDNKNDAATVTETNTDKENNDLSGMDAPDSASGAPGEVTGNDISEIPADSKVSQPLSAQETDNSSAGPKAEANPEEIKPEANSDPKVDKSDQGSGKEGKKPKTESSPSSSKADSDKNQTDEKSRSADSVQAKDKPQKADDSKIDDKPKPASNTSVDNRDDKAEVKRIVAIDAGHQRKGNYEQEPIGPGAKETKAKVSSGTQGRFTGVPEYELNLLIAKKVKDVLTERGYEVIMIRESHDVDLSNKERADIANESGAEIFIRIHANGSTNPSVHGTLTIYPSKKNPYVADLSEASHKLSKAIVDAICKNTGSKNLGAVARDDMSGINWSKIPVTIIEMGYMTNEKEDKLMQTEDYQDKIVQGICDGIDEYFSQ